LEEQERQEKEKVEDTKRIAEAEARKPKYTTAKI